MDPSGAVMNRAKGCLYGQAIGDALGTRYEFGDFLTTKVKVEKDKMGKSLLPILGGGPFNLAAGQVTDDTELAMALGRSLVRCGTFDPHDVAFSYASWYHSHPFDIGNTTRAALAVGRVHLKPQQKAEIYEEIRRNSARHNSSSLSNGCLMRISPLAIAATNWSEEKLMKSAEIDCQLTNPNEIAIDAVRVFCAAIRQAILTGDKAEAFSSAFKAAQTETIRNHLEAAESRMIPVVTSTGKSTNGDQTFIGYLGVAIQFAFHQMLKAEDFSSALEEVIRAGGDTDTNGCIAGALLGALFGATEIPDDYKKTVVQLKCKRQEKYDWVQLADLEEFAVHLTSVAEPNFAAVTETVDESSESASVN